jgi:hypothetical protein
VTQAWPFQPVNGGVPYDNEKSIVTAADLNTMCEQVAVMADGRIWTDVAILKGGHRLDGSGLFDPTNHPGALIRDPVSRRWLLFGSSLGANNAGMLWTISGARWFTVGAIGGSVTLGGTVAAAVNAAGVILAGAAPNSATAQKLIESTNGGDTWTNRSIGASNTESINAIAYSEALGLWLCSVGGTGGQGLFTSPDRIAWTNRWSAPANFLIVRDTPSPVLLASSLAFFPGNAASYLRSENGVDWFVATFPADPDLVSPNPEHVPFLNGITGQGCWSAAHGLFFQTTTSGIWASPDGRASSWRKVYSHRHHFDDALGFVIDEPATASIAAFGRMLVRGDGRHSVDGGWSWSSGPTFDVGDGQVDWRVAAAPCGVGLFRKASREVFLSLQVGF